MNFKRTWFWLFLAAGLFAFIYFFQHRPVTPAAGPARILPRLQPAAVTAIQVTTKGQLDSRVERTNDSWQLLLQVPGRTEPLLCPAQSASVEILLGVLAELVPARQFSESALTNRFNADKDYGFADAQATLLLEQPGESFSPIRIGTTTAPGDQVFLQVVGRDEIYVVDASLLKYIPRSPSAWRDTTFLPLKGLPFDTLTVASGNNRLVFQQEPLTHFWRMISPFAGRADNAKLTRFLQVLERARVQQFVSDQTNADVESLGLGPPEHELTLAQGTNVISRLQFGKSPTNNPAQVYARSGERPSIVTVPKEVLAPWSASMQVEDYRDPYLLHINEPLAAIEVRGGTNFSNFSLVRSNDTWQVRPQNFPADGALVNRFVSGLNQMKVAEFTAANVPETGLAQYGLAPPTRQYTLKGSPTASSGEPTNNVLAELSFGTETNRAGGAVVYARRADETPISVYAVPFADFHQLPAFAYSLRERRVWHFSINDVTGASIRQDTRTRQLRRNGPHSWSLVGDSQGIIEDIAVEETVKGLCDMSATAWVASDAQYRSQFGLAPGFLQITLELKNGDKATVELAKPLIPNSIHTFAAVTLDGQLWIFEFPANLFPDVRQYLSLH